MNEEKEHENLTEKNRSKDDDEVDIDYINLCSPKTEAKLHKMYKNIVASDDLDGDKENTENSLKKNKAHSDVDINSVKFSKRLSNESNKTTIAKELKLTPSESDVILPEKSSGEEKEATPEREKTPPLPLVRTLTAIDEYIKLKSLKKLTYKDLEQILLQKECEAICYKGENAELKHQLAVQEQKLERWQKEVVQVTKRTGDLEIVHGKTLQEVRLENERVEPLIPVKITRSVGLQVRLDTTMINNQEKEHENLTEKNRSKDDDEEVDIDYINLCSPKTEAKLHKVYKSIVASEDLDGDKENTGATDKPANEAETAAKTKDAFITEEDGDKMFNKKTDTCDGNVDKEEEKGEQAKTTYIRKRKNFEENSCASKNEENSLKKNKAHSDVDINSVKFSKRLSNESNKTTIAKELKLTPSESDAILPEKSSGEEKEATPEREKTPPLPPVRTLTAIDEYMKLKSLKKLTYKDLEQIILQKICEAICYKGENAELKHQLAVQEQMLERWPKEVVQVTKQTRDLEIVHGKMFQEVRLENERVEPLIPVKIRRSVGLQVRLDTTMINNQGPNTVTTTNKVTTTDLNVSTNKSAGKPAGEPKAAVIDRIDEDDKRLTTSTTTNSTLAQGVRIFSAPVKTVVTTAEMDNQPHIMHAHNNQFLASDPTKPGGQKLISKLNSNVIAPARDVIATVSTGSAIAAGNTPIKARQQVGLATPTNLIRISTTPVETVLRHPAPLPPPPANQLCLPSCKPIPPKPHLSIKRSNGDLILVWKIPYNLENFEAIASYQLYAYQETTSPPSSEMWRKVGEVKALALPIALTLTHFADGNGNKYHFAVRAVDVQNRMGPFSDPEQIIM